MVGCPKWNGTLRRSGHSTDATSFDGRIVVAVERAKDPAG